MSVHRLGASFGRAGALLLVAQLALAAAVPAAPTIQSQILTEPGGQAGDGFGRRMAVSGQTLIVGVNGDDDVAPDAGAAIVYARRLGEWIQVQKLAPSSLQTGDFLGWAADIDGDVAVVGAPGDDRVMPTGTVVGTAPNRGAAYVFRRGADGVWALEARLEGQDAAAGDEFGVRVAISGDTIMVSSLRHKQVGSSAFGPIFQGAVWVFRRGTTWTQEAKLSPVGAHSFGAGLALDGGRAAIGEIEAGNISIATRGPSGWSLAPLRSQLNDFFEGTGAGARFASIDGIVAGSGGNLLVLNGQAEVIRDTWRLVSVTPAGVVRQIEVLPEQPPIETIGMFGAAYRLRLASDNAGNAFVAYRRHILKRSPDGIWSSLAGFEAESGLVNGTGAAARFINITRIDTDAAGNLYALDDSTVRKITPGGEVTTLAGTLERGYVNDVGTAARFLAPAGFGVSADGIVYVADNFTIRTVTSDGTVSTIAGSAGIAGADNGAAGAARFVTTPDSLDVAPDGTVLILDNTTLRRMTPLGVVSTIPGVSAGPFLHARGADDVYFRKDRGATSPPTLLTVSHYEAGTSSPVAGPVIDCSIGIDTLFGYSLALSGDRLVVGNPRATTPRIGGALKAGCAFAYEWTGTAWDAGAALVSSSVQATERQGESVAIAGNGDLIVGGANGCTWVSATVCDDDSKNTAIASSVTPARVFRRTNGYWNELIALTRPEVIPRTGFGASLAAGSTLVVVGAPGGEVFPSNTAGEVYTFDLATFDADGDGLPDGWETQFGLDATSIAGADGAAGDPDDDGRTNAQEYAAQSMPTGLASATRYLAEGATGFFETRISITNAGTTAATVLLRFLHGSGAVTSHVLTVPAQQNRKIAVSTLPDMSSTEFSTVIEANQPVVVDRQMWWDSTAYGTHTETALAGASETWYFAEGATHSGFDLFYLLQNPSATDAQVRVRYLRPDAAPLEKVYTVPANRRMNIWADVEEFPAESGNRLLEATDVGAVVEVLNGVPIIAERAMYLSRPGALFEAGHESAGVTSPATHWFLAEGATGDFFDAFVLLANPSTSSSSQVKATYLLPDGSTREKTYTIAPSSRANIWLDAELFPDGLGGQVAALADTAVSVTIDVLNGVPIVVERSMWWPGPSADTWAEAHNTFGSRQTATAWAFAEGIVLGAPTNTETYFLIANTAATTARVRLTLLFDDGGAAVSKEYDVLPHSRFNVPVRDEFPAAVNRGFGAVIESLAPAAAPIVVERAMYNDAGGVMWRAGSAALGTPVAPSCFVPAGAAATGC